MRRSAQFGTIVLTVSCLACLSSQALAQAIDIEPNDSCVAAQDVGAVDGDDLLIVTGSLDTPPEEPDVDFFRLQAPPGVTLVAELDGEATGQGTLPDPFLGAFDADCDLIDINDDAGTLNSRLLIVVPDDGVIILAASSFPDDEFTGAGDTSGSYELSISQAPPPIGSIAGRVVDATSGLPLSGRSAPFAFVALLRCDAEECLELVAEEAAGRGGRFRFERDLADRPLLAETYQVIAVADEFEETATEPFDVAEDEDVDLGDIALEPRSIAFSDIQPCGDTLPQGGRCRYSVTVNNNTDTAFEGLAWSVVDGFEIPSSLSFTRFEASAVRGALQAVRVPVSLEPFGSQTLGFRFDLPASAAGAEFCTEIYLGTRPVPLVNTVRQAFLFCLAGTDSGAQVMSASAGRKTAKSLGGRPPALSKQPTP